MNNKVMTKKLLVVVLLICIVAGNFACKKGNPVDSTNWGLSGRILFSVGTSIYILDMNSPALALTRMADGFEPKVNPSKTMIAYDAISPQGSSDIYVIDVSGGQPTNLTNDKIGSDSWPDWSPDGSSIVFDRDFYNTTHEAVCVMHNDGSNLRVVTDTSTLAFAFMARWAPNGNVISFVGTTPPSKYGERIYSLYTMRPDGSSLALLDPNMAATLPLWSPDSRRIAYGKRNLWISDTTYGLYVVDSDTRQSQKIVLGNTQSTIEGFSWLPDGRLICVGTSLVDSSSGVFVVSFSPSFSQNVTATGFKSTPSTAPSPDGNSIAILGQRGDDQSITLYLVGSDGTKLQKLKETGLQGRITAYNDWFD
jgi:Tol biopolymer transport system component